MRSSDFVWRLVQSLNMREIEGFYFIAAIHNEGKTMQYVELFKVLRESDSYDETALKELFPVGNFSDLKQRLEKKILRSLAYFRDTEAADIDRRTLEIEILIEKGFYKRATQKISVAKKAAAKLEAFTKLLTILEHENTILVKGPETIRVAEEAERIYQERVRVTKLHNNLLEYQNLYNLTYAKIKTSYTPKGKFETELAKSTKRLKLLSHYKHAYSDRARMYFYRLRYIVHYLMGELDQAADVVEKIRKIYQKHPHFVQEDEDRFHMNIFHVAMLSISAGNYSRAKNLLKYFGTRNEKHAGCYELFYLGQITYSIYAGEDEDWKKTVRSFVATYKIIQPEQAKLNGNPYLIYLGICRLYFRNQEYAEAHNWVKRILDEQKRGYRIDILAQAKLINVIIQLELGNYDLAESYIKRAADFLNRNEKYFEFERLLLNLLRFILRNDDPSILEKKLFQTFKEIQKALQSDSSIRTFYFFDYMSWIELRLAQVRTQTASST